MTVLTGLGSGDLPAVGYTTVGSVFLVVGLVVLGLLRTDANVFGAAISSVVASWVVGLALQWCGMNAAVADARQRARARRRETLARDVRDAPR